MDSSVMLADMFSVTFQDTVEIESCRHFSPARRLRVLFALAFFCATAATFAGSPEFKILLHLGGPRVDGVRLRRQFLSWGELQRLGGKETIAVDVRVVAATHRDLETAIRQQEFREDLYYRLSVVVITLPPLRNRKEDVPELVRYFLQKYGPELGCEEPSIHTDAMDFLQGQTWPGNVRELENVVRKALLAAQNYTINLDHVRATLDKTNGLNYSPARAFGEYLDDLLAAARREELFNVHPAAKPPRC